MVSDKRHLKKYFKFSHGLNTDPAQKSYESEII